MDAYIKASFWTDERLEEQPPEIKLACLWLISNPGRDLLGITKVSNKRFTFETGLDARHLEGACKALPTSFQKLAPGVYFAVHFLRHQFGKGGRMSLVNKVVISVQRQAAQLAEPLATPFRKAYPELFETDEKPTEKPLATDPPSDFSEGVIEEKSKSKSSEELFEEEGMQGGKPDVPGIVALYPRRENVMAACTAVQDHLRRGFSVDAIISGTRAIAAVISQMPGAHLNKFVPSAETFFRMRRWEDDPATWLRGGANGSGAPTEKLELHGRGRSGTTIKIQSTKPTTKP